MKIILFYHSLISDWNHGNAHFLRGICTELIHLGHDVRVYEPKNGWSFVNMIKDAGEESAEKFSLRFSHFNSSFYVLQEINLEAILHDADLVMVHEWNDHQLVKEIGAHHKLNKNYTLLFHDTHHRAASDASSIGAYDLSGYDGVLAYGKVIKDIYLKNKWTENAWVWHEAADTNIFYCRKSPQKLGDLVWIGNWGDDERTEEIFEFLINPVQELGLKAKVYGVRYPDNAIKALKNAGIDYGGWLPNHLVPFVFSRYKVTVHIPRKYYSTVLPGIPTIRPFEALACEIPLISAPWNDSENLFTPGKDYLVADNGEKMKKLLMDVIANKTLSESLTAHGLKTIQDKHTCRHRTNELLSIVDKIKSAKKSESVELTGLIK
jgi:spore maturation protein CgeB